MWKDKKYIEQIKVFNRAIRYFLGLTRTAPIVGMCGDMGWIAPAYSLSLNRLRLWNKLCAMHPDRLTKRIFEWDWLKKNSNWSEDILHLINKLDMAIKTIVTLKKLKINYMNFAPYSGRNR